MSISLRLADPADLPRLLALAQAFHAEDGHALDARGEAAMAALLADTDKGRLWLIVAAGEPVGYAALCFGFSIEYGGRDAFIDDIYVVPEARGKGIGSRILDLVCAAARDCGCLALHLEVMEDNAGAARLYERHGFRDRSSRLMSLRMEQA